MSTSDARRRAAAGMSPVAEAPTATTTRRAAADRTDAVIVERKPAPPAIPTLLVLLAATSLLGTFYAYIYSDPAHTSFRSRLPASILGEQLKTTSLFPSTLPYFADKRNIFNQLFVKKAWAWTTLVWFAYILASFTFPPTRSTRDAILIQSDRVPVLLRQLRRWTLATFFWWFLTQGTWFFGVGVGPSLAQRLLLYSGAQCVPAALSSSSTIATENLGGVLQPPPVCVGAKGDFYQGGHDVSGHTFLLIHASLLLWETIRPTVTSLPFFRRSSTSPALAPSPPAIYTAYASLALILLWEVMLLATSIYFHTPQEKVSGLLFGVIGWWFSSL